MTIQVGEHAPDFELPDQHGTPVRLSSFRGDRNVVLMFYPLTFTGVCGGELCAIRDDLAHFDNDTTTTLAVSVDSMVAHRVWAEREGFTFPLLADFWPHGEVAMAYGVFDEERGVATRGTFIIDREGIVRYAVNNAIPDARDQAEYRKVLDTL